MEFDAILRLHFLHNSVGILDIFGEIMLRFFGELLLGVVFDFQ
jgi:hypothetical protein